MPQVVYECMFILDPNRYAAEPHKVGGTPQHLIEAQGGEVLASRLWNEQKLAYPIKGHRKGVYWLTYFRLESTKLVDFNRACQLTETVLRHLALKVEPRLVDTLLAHARGEVSAAPAAQPAEPAKA